MKRTGVLLIILSIVLGVLAWTAGLVATVLTSRGGEPIWEAVAWWACVPLLAGFVIAVVCTYAYFEAN